MKKLLCLLLAAATIFSLCACSQPEVPVNPAPTGAPTTAPSTAPTQPEPSEPLPTDPPQPPSNFFDWEDFSFRLEGKEYRLPCNFSEFMADGWTLKDDYADNLPLSAYTTLPVYMRKGDLKVMLRLVNPTDSPKPEESCKVDGIWIFDTDRPVSFEFANGCAMGSSVQQILDTFGAAANEDWYGEGDDDGEPTTLHMLRYQTELGYDQSMTFFFDPDIR